MHPGKRCALRGLPEELYICIYIYIYTFKLCKAILSGLKNQAATDGRMQRHICGILEINRDKGDAEVRQWCREVLALYVHHVPHSSRRINILPKHVFSCQNVAVIRFVARCQSKSHNLQREK